MNAAGQICHVANYRPDRRNRRHGDPVEYGFRANCRSECRPEQDQPCGDRKRWGDGSADSAGGTGNRIGGDHTKILKSTRTNEDGHQAFACRLATGLPEPPSAGEGRRDLVDVFTAVGLMQVGGPFYLLDNVGSSQNSGDDLVGALDYGRDNHAARDCPGRGALRGGATWACGVFGKMPRRRQGMRQSLYVEISNQGRRMERCHARLH
jgi:hypothetical protein